MGSNDLKLQYYKVLLLSIKRSNRSGVYVNAKPILVLSFFDLIEKRVVEENKFFFDNALIKTYIELSKSYEKEKSITPCVYPFFHIRNDGFINLTFENHSTKLPHTPSARYLRENVKYASFDNALWDLLQDDKTRSILKKTIINHFLTPKNLKSHNDTY